jgi:hypothetical protein
MNNSAFIQDAIFETEMHYGAAISTCMDSEQQHVDLIFVLLQRVTTDVVALWLHVCVAPPFSLGKSHFPTLTENKSRFRSEN